MSKSKVACETAAALPDDAGAVQYDAGAPAESALLRVSDGGVGLTHLFGAALRRDGSTKGSSNPKSAAEAATRAPRPADPRRLPGTTTTASSKTAVVIGVVLPASKVVAKERRARARAPGRVVVARAWRRPAAGARVFASEAGVGPEPVSPKVSCFGAVLSAERSSAAAAAPAAGTQEDEEGTSGCWARLLRTALLGLCREDSNGDREGHHGHLCRASEPNSKAAAAPEPQRVAVMSPPRPVAPGLGDVKRLASRRWPETMARGAV